MNFCIFISLQSDFENALSDLAVFEKLDHFVLREVKPDPLVGGLHTIFFTLILLRRCFPFVLFCLLFFGRLYLYDLVFLFLLNFGLLAITQLSEILDFGDVDPVFLAFSLNVLLCLLLFNLGSAFLVESLGSKGELIGHHFLEFQEAFGCLFLDPHVLSLSHFHGYKGSSLIDELKLSPCKFGSIWSWLKF